MSQSKIAEFEHHLTQDLILDLLDCCFNKESLLPFNQDLTWNKLVKVAQSHGWMTTVDDMKDAWNFVIDGKLNGICGTYVEEKEKFKDWRNMRVSGVKIDREIMVNVLWTRLLCVYQQRITLRGWTGGDAYKTLKEEKQEMLSNQSVGHLETNAYFVLEDGSSVLDVNFSNAIRSCILAFGGKLVNVVTPETIVICSFDLELNGRMFANVRNCKQLIDRMSFIESLRKMNKNEKDSKPKMESLLPIMKPAVVSSPNASIAEFIECDMNENGVAANRSVVEPTSPDKNRSEGYNSDVADEEVLSTDQRSWANRVWDEGQQLLAALFFKHAKVGNYRTEVRRRVLQDIGIFGFSGQISPGYVKRSLDNTWIKWNQPDVEEAFKKTGDKYKNLVGLDTLNKPSELFVKDLADYLAAALKRQLNFKGAKRPRSEGRFNNANDASQNAND